MDPNQMQQPMMMMMQDPNLIHQQIMMPPVDPNVPREVHPTVDGGVVHQVRHPGMHQKIHEQASFTMHHPTTVQTHEVAPPQYHQGPSTEQEMPPQYINIDQEHAVMGPVEQQVQEIHTVHYTETYHDIPEVQVSHSVQEVHQVVHEPV